jgi:hypothetical protein
VLVLNSQSDAVPISYIADVQARRLSKIVAGARASLFSQFIIRACIQIGERSS